MWPQPKRPDRWLFDREELAWPRLCHAQGRTDGDGRPRACRADTGQSPAGLRARGQAHCALRATRLSALLHLFFLRELGDLADAEHTGVKHEDDACRGSSCRHRRASRSTFAHLQRRGSNSLDRLINRKSGSDLLVRRWSIDRRSARASARSSSRGPTLLHPAVSRQPSCRMLSHFAETSSKVIDVDPNEGMAGSDDGERQNAALLLNVERQLCANELDRANVPHGPSRAAQSLSQDPTPTGSSHS